MRLNSSGQAVYVAAGGRRLNDNGFVGADAFVACLLETTFEEELHGLER